MTRTNVFAMLILFIFPTYAFANGFHFNETTGLMLLKGEKDICILYDHSNTISDEFRKQLATDVELKLRTIGVEPKKECGFYDSSLLVTVHAAEREGIYAGTIIVSYCMPSTFVKTNILSYSEVWSGWVAFGDATATNMKLNATNLVDKFLNVYLKANPRKFVPE